ncbi:MAG: hypothetical protein KatS3mg017_0485 [Fimbriimonadales bacterium]|nr:MAG: hypothetical protein KatS3mg017_0485 [Fimbriimonadales bacterium]GIV07974.1 MAG: hypothetical protein KatS3mg019_0065 [Fimbriimonadales bacterium]
MPIVIIHGIGVREDGFKRLAACCEPILRKYLLSPLRLETLETRWVYWGRHGAWFAWNLQSLPRAGVLESLGATPDEQITEAPAQDGLLFEAQRDLPALINQLVVQAIQRDELDPEALIALYDAAHLPQVQQAVKNAQSEEELRNILVDALAARKTRSLEVMGEIGIKAALEALLKTAIEATDYPLRLARVIIQRFLRPAFTELTARLLGDVMIYLANRGEPETPGAILQTVQTSLVPAPNEPLIVLTHSMGGNIFYDLITYYAPDVQVDAWVSVAGQVGLLEELKLFKASNPAVRSPKRVAVSSNIGYWLNVYDPVDVLGFAASPIFDGVEDMSYKTGSGWSAHALEQYFGAPRFYETIAPKLEAVLRR